MKQLNLTDRQYQTLKTALFVVEELQKESVKESRKAHPDCKGETSAELNYRRLKDLIDTVEA